MRITHTLETPATVTADTTDNTHLDNDVDGDCVALGRDCSPMNGQVWAEPGEVPDLWLSHTGGSGGATTLSWGWPTPMGGTAVNYIVVTEDGAACAESNVGAPYTPPEMRSLPRPVRSAGSWFKPRTPAAAARSALDSLQSPRTGCN